MFRFMKCRAVSQILSRYYGFDKQTAISLGRQLKEDGYFLIQGTGGERDGFADIEDCNAHMLAAQIAIERLKIHHEVGPPEFPLKKLAEHKAFIQLKITSLAHKFNYEPNASRIYLGRLHEFDYLDAEHPRT